MLPAMPVNPLGAVTLLSWSLVLGVDFLDFGSKIEARRDAVLKAQAIRAVVALRG